MQLHGYSQKHDKLYHYTFSYTVAIVAIYVIQLHSITYVHVVAQLEIS